jgi:Protein of unknown function (DUF2877)
VIAQLVAAPVLGRRVVAPYSEQDGFVTVVVGRGGPLLPNGVVLTGSAQPGPVALAGAEVWDPTLRIGPDPAALGRRIAEAVGVDEALTGDPEQIGARLIGRGPGLTPEGDDVVAGLAAVVATHDKAWAAALVGTDLRRRTTALSATLLELAMRGMGPEPLQALVAGQLGALDRLLRVGHTSGRAYARGAAAGLMGYGAAPWPAR